MSLLCRLLSRTTSSPLREPLNSARATLKAPPIVQRVKQRRVARSFASSNRESLIKSRESHCIERLSAAFSDSLTLCIITLAAGACQGVQSSVTQPNFSCGSGRRRTQVCVEDIVTTRARSCIRLHTHSIRNAVFFSRFRKLNV